MFSRGTTNPLDEVVTKTTDENLTSENWELILHVCDKVDADNENGARNAISAIQKRLGHRNANVQLFSLSLAEALSKSCGSKVHREIASRGFTQALMRLLNDRTIHAKVKSRTAELIKAWADDFKRDPSLGIMTETYNAMKAQGISVAPPPSRPQKKDVTEADRRREEEELQVALAMSLNDVKISKTSTVQAQSKQNHRNEVDNGPNAYTVPTSTSNNDPYNLPKSSSTATGSQAPDQTAQIQQTPIAERTAATVSRVRALYDFTASETGELSFRRGDIIQVIESAYKDWWRGSLHGNVGIFPTNYVENLADPTPADLQREAEEEQKIFSEAKNVEKLLSILSSAESNDPKFADNEQLQDLYHSTISIRPKLVRLIEKCAQKKDDLISLNEKFMKARKDYDELMEASLSRYNTSSYSPRAQYPGPRQGVYQPNMAGPPHGGYDRPQYGGDYRPQGASIRAPEQRTTSIPEIHQQRSGPPGPGVFQQQPSQPYSNAPLPQQQQHMTLEPSDPYRSYRQENHRSNPQVNTSSPQYASRPPQAGPSAQQYPPSTQDRQGSYHEQNNNVPGSFPQQLPTSPSQELAQAFPTAPEPPRTSTYDHERAEREGGPPIAYYSEHPDAVLGNQSPEVAPDSADHHLTPSAPDYAQDEESQAELPDYYRRAD